MRAAARPLGTTPAKAPPKPSTPSNALAIGSSLALALYLPMYAGVSGYELATQLAAVALVGFAALAAGFGGFQPAPFSWFELAAYGVCGLSFLVCLNEGNDYVGSYTVVMTMVLLATSLLARSVDLDVLHRVPLVAFCAMVISTVLFEKEALTASLLASPEERWALRFAPFGMHPNLCGFVYGGGATLFVSEALQPKRRNRGLAVAAGALCLLLVLAASSRAGVLAAGAGMALSVGLAYGAWPVKVRRACWIALAVLCTVLLVYSGSLIAYLITALELDSNSRGLESGGSGRSELWAQGLETIYNRGWRSMFGGGLRSASPENIGFLTENSYIHIILESGVFAGGALIAALAGLVVQLARGLRSEAAGVARRALPVMAFVMVQSFFNRYLFAIGNPLSLWFLIMCVRLSIGPIQARESSRSGQEQAQR